MLLWCDIETTGLEPASDYLLEWAMALTDRDLRIVAEFHEVVGWRNVRQLVRDSANEGRTVREMHERNGLFDACEASRLCLREVEAHAIEWIREHNAAGLYMAGSGVHFDRAWLKTQAPAAARLWHYRNFDLTTLRYFFGLEKVETAHRAHLDVRQNIVDLRRYAALARSAGLVALPSLALVAS